MKKNIIITGASSGLGKEMALKFAKNKANLLLIARNKTRLDEVVILATKYGAKVISKICDVFEKDKLKQIILDFNNDSKNMNRNIDTYDNLYVNYDNVKDLYKTYKKENMMLRKSTEMLS